MIVRAIQLAVVLTLILRSIGGLPPHIVGTFEEAINFQQSSNGTYYIFDRAGHAVHTVDAATRFRGEFWFAGALAERRRRSNRARRDGPAHDAASS